MHRQRLGSTPAHHRHHVSMMRLRSHEMPLRALGPHQKAADPPRAASIPHERHLGVWVVALYSFSLLLSARCREEGVVVGISSTHADCEHQQSCVSHESGTWSSLSWIAFPLRQRMTRASPAFAATSFLPPPLPCRRASSAGDSARVHVYAQQPDVQQPHLAACCIRAL